MWNKIKIFVYIAIAIGLFLLGVFIGRKTINFEKTDTEIKYMKGDTVFVDVPVEKLIPKEVIIPIDTCDIIKYCVENNIYYDLFPEKIKDSIIYVSKRDSAVILRDYATKRKYEEIIYDNDTLGTCKVKMEVQFNRLSKFNFSLNPITKTINTTEYKIKKYSPFIGGGLSTTPSFNAIGGMFFNDKYGFGIEYNYNYNLKQSSYGGYFLVKF